MNQCLLNDKVPVSISDNNQVSTVGAGNYFYKNKLNWVLHNEVGYVFPMGGNVFLSNKTQSGNWYDINTAAPKMEQDTDVFTLGFDHGLSPRDATYAYIVVPNKKTAEDMAAYPASNIEILANSDSMQVVRNKKLDVWEMVFYRAATFSHGKITVKVDKGCALLFKDMENSASCFHIADPAQAQSVIRVDVCIPSVAKDTKTIVCDFSDTGIYAGMSKVYSLEKSED